MNIKNNNKIKFEETTTKDGRQVGILTNLETETQVIMHSSYGKAHPEMSEWYDLTEPRSYISWVQKEGKARGNQFALVITEDGSMNLSWNHVGEDTITCPKCNGTGIFEWGPAHPSGNGHRVNSGECFKCKGKGEQSFDDKIRNGNYIPKYYG